MPTEITEIHRAVANAIWRGLRNLEILDELKNPRGRFNLNLSDSAELEMELQINRIRKAIDEARRLAPAFAEQKFREGREWKEVLDALSRPYLLSSFEVTGIAQKAHAAVKAEQEQEA